MTKPHRVLSFACALALVLVATSALTQNRLSKPLPIGLLATASDDGVETFAPKAAGISDALFRDSFEPGFSPPQLLGNFSLTSKSYFSPSAKGSSIASTSDALAAATNQRFLFADTNYLGQIQPFAETFVNNVDFRSMTNSYGGLVNAAVTPVDVSLDNPGASTSGCEADDFQGFPVGNIALIQRGACPFAVKARLAGEAGASAVVVFNQGTDDRFGLFAGTLGDDYDRIEPAVSVSYAQGARWARLASERGLTLEINTVEGTRANAWTLTPVVTTPADLPVFWLTNVASGSTLYSAELSELNGTEVHQVRLGNVGPNDANGWWTLFRDEGNDTVRFRNVATGEILATVVNDGGIFLLTGNETELSNGLCTGDPNCGRWRVPEQVMPPPPGAARLRNALGGFYLQVDDVTPRVEPIKSGWDQALWTFEVVQGTNFRRLRNVVTQDYIHVENGAPELGDIESGWWSAMWTLEPATVISQINTPTDTGSVPRTFTLNNPEGYYLLRNRWTNQLLVRRDGALRAENVPNDMLAAVWIIQDQEVQIADSNLRSAINANLNQGPSAPIRSSEAAGIETLFAGNSGINSLAGIENLYNLKDLRLANNPFTDVTPLASLVKLEKLNLVDSAVSNMDPLLLNPGLGRDDVVLVTGSPLRWDDRETGRVFREKNITAVPAPGDIALRVNNTRLVVEARNLNIVDYADADATASWTLEYDPPSGNYFLSAFPDGRKQYFYFIEDDSDIWDNDIPRNNSGEFQLERLVFDVYRIRHRNSGKTIRNCFGKISVRRNDQECTELSFYIPETYLGDSRAIAQSNFYDPDFAPPSGGYTRIQNTKARTFLRATNNNSVVLAEVAEGWTSAHWELVPLQMSLKYVFLIRNRFYPDRYLSRSANGTLQLGRLPGNAPTDASWANNADNARFVFDLDGNTLGTFNVRPLGDDDAALRESGGNPAFSGQLSSRSFWRFDGGVAVADVPNKVIVLQEPTDAILSFWSPSFAIRWLEPESTFSPRMREVKRQGPGVYQIPATAREVRILITCTNCGFAWESERERTETVELFELDRPVDACYETRGDQINPSVSECDPAEGQLAVLAEELAAEYACPLEVMFNSTAEAYTTLGMENVSGALLEGDLDAAKQSLVDMGNLSGPDFSNCSFPFRSASYGAGGQAGIFDAEESGELGLTWNLLPDAAGPPIWSYSSLAREVNPQARLLTLAYEDTLGWWVTEAEQLRGRSVGLTLNSNQMKTLPTKIAFAASRLTALVGPSVNISLWLGCDTGAGPVIYDDRCTVRRDSDFIGVTLDLSVGTDLSLPKVRGIGVSYSETCVPAGLNSLGDCPRRR